MCEETLSHKRVEDVSTHVRSVVAQAEEALRLFERDAQTRNFLELSADPFDESPVRHQCLGHRFPSLDRRGI
jgi:hypothetical protein